MRNQDVFSSRKLGKPNALSDLLDLEKLLRQKTPFTFVRFSDGESEILHGSDLRLENGKTLFQGRQFGNQFEKWDSKIFNAELDREIRTDLIRSALFRDRYYLKGILTSGNARRSERFLMERWNSGSLGTLTFTDLLINENYTHFLASFLPQVAKTTTIAVVCNFRATLPKFAHLKVSVPDNFFKDYSAIRDRTLSELLPLPKGSTVLSSASSLSNVLGHRLRQVRPDLTFVDVGTSINHLLGFTQSGRAYLTRPMGGVTRKILFYLQKRDMRIRW